MKIEKFFRSAMGMGTLYQWHQFWIDLSER